MSAATQASSARQDRIPIPTRVYVQALPSDAVVHTAVETDPNTLFARHQNTITRQGFMTAPQNFPRPRTMQEPIFVCFRRGGLARAVRFDDPAALMRWVTLHGLTRYTLVAERSVRRELRRLLPAGP